MERAAEAVRIEKEQKEARLRANKQRLSQLQATWREDQQLKEVFTSSPHHFSMHLSALRHAAMHGGCCD